MKIILTSKEELSELLSEAIKSLLPVVQPQPKKEESLISKKECASRLGVSEPTVDNYRRNGIIPSYKIGAAVRFKWSEVIHALNST